MAKFQTWELTPDEIVDGLMVTAGTGLQVKVSPGIYRMDGKTVEVKAEVTLTVPASTTGVTVYVNPEKDWAGNTMNQVDIVKEADRTHTNINGTVGKTFGRSIPLATLNTDGAGPVAGTIDNTARENFLPVPKIDR